MQRIDSKGGLFHFTTAKMFTQPLVPLLFCLFAQLASVSSSPLVAERAASTCSANDIATVKRTAPVDPVYFCQWWQQE